jgi:hypothetical protein
VDSQRLGRRLYVLVGTVAVRLEEQLVIGGHGVHYAHCKHRGGLVSGRVCACAAQSCWRVGRSSGVKSAVVGYVRKQLSLVTTQRSCERLGNSELVGGMQMQIQLAMNGKCM